MQVVRVRVRVKATRHPSHPPLRLTAPMNADRRHPHEALSPPLLPRYSAVNRLFRSMKRLVIPTSRTPSRRVILLLSASCSLTRYSTTALVNLFYFISSVHGLLMPVCSLRVLHCRRNQAHPRPTYLLLTRRSRHSRPILRSIQTVSWPPCGSKSTSKHPPLLSASTTYGIGARNPVRLRVRVAKRDPYRLRSLSTQLNARRTPSSPKKLMNGGKLGCVGETVYSGQAIESTFRPRASSLRPS